MANDSTANVKVIVSTDGTISAANKEAEALHNNLKGAATAAAKVRMPRAAAAAQAGLSAANAGRESGLGRAVGPGKGAEARDFAEQAQGLGGLVRVYATFAANIFAVSAAFTALSRAYDTANLVKGLDQLGAASGKNLGSLAKQLVAATDGAISLREAMKTTAGASAAGISGTNILRLGNIAKQASQALGVDMANAVDRLSRGITKLEPELLDEIGIFTRVDKANQDYARSIGKSVTALTDFEKRQAFANAVLKEGEDKFGNIKIDANPYTKIAASFQNLTDAGLNVINKILTPITSILSSSPAALGVAIAGFAQVLLRQAIPALSQWREGLDKVAERSRNAVIATNALRKERVIAFDSDIAEKTANAAEAAAKKAQLSLDKIYEGQNNKLLSPTTSKLIPTKLEAINNEQIKLVEDRIKLLQKEYDKGGISDKALKRREQELNLLKQAVPTLKEYVAAEAKYQEELDRPRVTKGRIGTFFSEEAQRERLADRAAAKSQRANILSDVSKNMDANGIALSFKALNDQIAKARDGFDKNGVAFDNNQKKMTAFNAGLTRTIGTIQIGAAALGTLVSSLSGLLIGITVVVGVFQLLDSVFSKSAKQADEYSAALGGLESSVDSVGKTLDFIANKKGAAVISPESIQASANAFNELSENINRTANTFGKLLEAQSGWDKVIDSLFDAVGRGNADKLATQLSSSIVASLNLVEDGPAKEQAKKTFADLVGADPTSPKAMEKALKDLTAPEIASKAKDIAKAVAEISREANNSAATLTAAVQGIKDTSKLVTDLNNTLKPTDIQAKIGDALISRSFKIGEALKDPIGGLDVLKEAVNDVNFLSLLPDAGKDLALAKDKIEEVSKSLGDVTANRKKLEDEIAKAPKEENRSKNDPLGAALFGDSVVVKGATKELKDALAAAIAEEAKLKAAAAELTTRFAGLGDKVLGAGVDKLLVSLKGAFELGGIEAARGYLSVIRAAGGRTADQEARLKQQELGIQQKNIEAQFAQIRQAAILTVAMEESANATNLLAATLQLSNADNVGGERAAVTKRIEALNQDKDKITAKKALLDTSGKGMINAYSSFAKSDNAALKGAAVDLAGYFTQAIGIEGQKAGIAGKSAAIEAQRKAGVLQEEADAKKKLVDQEITTITLQKEQLNNSQEILGFFDAEYARKKLQLDQAAAQAAYDKERIDSETKIAQLKIGLGTSADQKTLTADIATAEAEAAKKASDFEKKRTEDARKAQFELAKGTEQLAAKERERNEKIREYDIQTQQSGIALLEARLSTSQALGTITEENAAIAKAELDTERAKLDTELESLKTINARKTLEANRDAKLAGAAGNADLQSKIKADSAAEIAVLDAQSVKNAQIAKDKLAIIEITKNQALEQAKVNEHLKEQQVLTDIITNMTTNLADAFGEVGQAVGQATKAIIDSAEKQYQINRQLDKDRKAYKEDPQKLAKIESKAAYDIADAKMQSYQSVLGASKKLFGEQTKMGKALAAAEKGIALARAAAAAQELATQLGITSAKIAAKWTEIQTDGLGAVVKTLSSIPFPFNVAAAATVAGIVASLTGKNVQVPAGGTAAEQQSVQGTGQTFVGSRDGKPVDRIGGVLGDAKAKSEDVANSIAIMEKYQFKTLEFSNKSLDELRAIKKNTEGLAGLLVSVKGLQSGSGFGTSEGSDPGKLFGLFGKSSTEILDAGIQLKGTFQELAKGAGQLNQFENVKKKSSSLFGLVSSTSFSTNTKSLDDKVVSGIKDLFQSAGDSIVSLGDAFGKESKDRLAAVLQQTTVDFKISTKGLSGAEIAKALEAEIGIALNGAVESVYPFVKDFQQVGEGLLTTLTRLDNDRNVVNRTLEGIGVNFKDAAAAATSGMENSTVASLRMYESLINLSGGLEEFTKKTTFFSDKFLTDAEKLAPVQAAVSKEFERLGIAAGTSREDFKKLVLGLDLTTESGQQTYANLMNVAEGFDLVVSNAEKFNAAVLDKQVQLMKLSGDITKATNIERTNEINKLKQLSKAEADVLVPLQEQIYAKIDEASAIKLNISLLQAQGKSYAALILQRQEELKAMTDAEKALKIQIYDAENIAKVRSKDLTLLEMQGNATYVLGLRREDELATMSEQEQVVQKLIYAEQDRAKIRAIELEIVNALGMSYTGLLMAREKELAGLTDSEKALKTYLYKVQDQAKTDALNIELMEAQGNSTGALLAKRKQELKGLSATDQSLKVRIYRLQDEKKLLDIKSSQEQKIYTLLGNSAAALAIIRKQELEAMDAQLRPAQEYIYALEDELALKDQLKAAYEKESSALKDTIKGLKSSSQALKDYRDSLLVGDKSILTPTQKYAEAKSQALQLAAIAQGPATTEAEIEARDRAISKLPSATDTWLEASRNLYASSETYSNDFGMALGILDTVSGALDAQMTDAEKQLSAIENQSTILDIIKDNTKSTATLLSEYLAAQKATEEARLASAAAGSVASGGTNKDPTAQNVAATLEGTTLTGTTGTTLSKEAMSALIDSLAVSNPSVLYKALVTDNGVTSQQVDSVMGYPPGTALRWALEQGFPAFKNGGIASGMSIVGENGPELVNFPAPTKVYSNRQTNDIANSNQALIQEIKALRDEVAQLRQEQKEQTGHLITAAYDSNMKAADTISEASNDGSSEWNKRVAVKLA